jgi:hypothetical protein
MTRAPGPTRRHGFTIIEGPVHEQTHRLFEGVKSTDLKILVDVLAQIRSRRA